MRICSLLPSATEIVFSLGLDDQLVAVTHECDFPPEVSRFPRITRSAIDHTGSSSREIHNHISQAVHRGSSIYELDQDLLEQLNPDLILTQELCDVCAVSYKTVQTAVRLLDGRKKIVSLEPTSLADILNTITRVGEIAGVSKKSKEVVELLERRIDSVRARTNALSNLPRVFAMEWLDPPFVAGHWVPEMIESAGGTDGLGKKGAPSSVITWERIAEYDPEIMVLMPCGFDLESTTRELRRAAFPGQWRELVAVQERRVYAVNGSAYFNRPGPRIVDGLEILAEIIHPELFPRKSSPDSWQPVFQS